jgi:DNA-binding MarR family transcriptional regulator
MVTKLEILQAVEDLGDPTAQELADHLGLVYHEAAVAALRCNRAGLLDRWRDAHDEPYRYKLMPHGLRRLRYLEALEEEEDAEDPDEDEIEEGDVGEEDDEEEDDEDEDDEVDHYP